MYLAGREYIKTLSAIIPSAEDCIRIATFKAELSHSKDAPELLAFWEEVFRKSRAGVRVRALIHYGDKRASCPKTNYLILKKLYESKAAVRYVSPGGCQHMKLVLIDGCVGFIGSHNLSVASAVKNHELSKVITDEAEVKELTDLYDSFFNNATIFRGQHL